MTRNAFDDFLSYIESYYLNLKGEGIMLSPKEYQLIVNWRSRSVPKEIVTRGIRRAFEKDFAADHDRKQNFRNLTQCAAYVEELIQQYKSGVQTDLSESEHDNNRTIQSIVERLNQIISNEKRESIRKYYLGLRTRILEMLREDEADLFNRLSKIEAEFYQDVFRSMSEVEQKRLIEQAAAHLSARERFMTKQARAESLISFRNELLIKKLNLINFNTIY